MTDKIIIATAPDDTLIDGVRIAHIQLSEDQSSLISNTLLNADLQHTIINYVWKVGDPKDWLFDKLPKCDAIIFNADTSIDERIDLILGWISAQPKSYYFGTLRDLNIVNDRCIRGIDDIVNLLEKASRKYG